jgi:hypothetical protein
MGASRRNTGILGIGRLLGSSGPRRTEGAVIVGATSMVGEYVLRYAAIPRSTGDGDGANLSQSMMV